MLEWLEKISSVRDAALRLELNYPEGSWVGAGEPIVYITGSFVALSELETILLQKLGPACVAAHNAYQMCLALPGVEFLAMEARHCAGEEMHDMMSYAASVGGAAARKEGAKGFTGSATQSTAHWFGATRGIGTMPHSLIGYAGSTVRAAEMFHETFPDDNLTALTDYFGREITDGLAVCGRFPELAASGRLSVRLDTHGGRFLEGLIGRKLRGDGAPRPRRDPPISERCGVALPGRYRRFGGCDLADAGSARRSGLWAGADHRLVGFRRR